MTSELLRRILDLPVIIQSALGSLLFWLVFELSKILGRLAMNAFGETSKSWLRTRRIQEYMYRRYTSRNGYLPVLQG
jgi:hypothetical protein